MNIRETMLAGLEGLCQQFFDAGYKKALEDIRELEDAAPPRSFDLTQVPIEELRFPFRIHNCLKREGHDFIADVLALNDEALRAIRNFQPEESIPALDGILEVAGLRRACRR